MQQEEEDGALPMSDNKVEVSDDRMNVGCIECRRENASEPPQKSSREPFNRAKPRRKLVSLKDHDQLGKRKGEEEIREKDTLSPAHTQEPRLSNKVLPIISTFIHDTAGFSRT